MVRKSKERKYKILSTILAVVVILLSTYITLTRFIPAEKVPPLLPIPQLSTLGFEKVKNVEVRIVGDEGIITLLTNCYSLTAGVEITQATSIQNALLNKSELRPNAHDLTRDVFNTLGIKVLMVKITELRDRAYLAEIALRQGGAFLNFAVRPSDGIAIALRTGSPIYIKKDLLITHGKYIC